MLGMIMDESQKMRSKNGLYPDDPDYFSILANKETERLYSAFNENSRDFYKRKIIGITFLPFAGVAYKNMRPEFSAVGISILPELAYVNLRNKIS